MLVALLIKILTIGDDQALSDDYLKLIIVIIALHGFYCSFKFYRISAEFVTINRHYLDAQARLWLRHYNNRLLGVLELYACQLPTSRRPCLTPPPHTAVTRGPTVMSSR